MILGRLWMFGIACYCLLLQGHRLIGPRFQIPLRRLFHQNYIKSIGTMSVTLTESLPKVGSGWNYFHTIPLQEPLILMNLFALLAPEEEIDFFPLTCCTITFGELRKSHSVSSRLSAINGFQPGTHNGKAGKHWFSNWERVINNTNFFRLSVIIKISFLRKFKPKAAKHQWLCNLTWDMVDGLECSVSVGRMK